ncbi:hypothetical protein [Halobacteriovorax sp. HLS]|uniref:hypothetical protein n=1 Tax=Halobacteriovorax sp. HLS TaxID=2234000 RepID=UPI000FD75B8D|nr:hypothetical protein [Halobacteriovorax sp. HLS]
MNYITENNQILHLIIRVPKEDAAFFYFQLEANEGICFYSTLENSMKESYRDITVTAHIGLEEELMHIISKLQQSHKLEILKKEIKEDAQI